MAMVNEQKTQVTRERYDRVAPLYDTIEWVMELRVRRWRRELWSSVEKGRILELGVGTGKNIPYYPPGAEVTAADLSENMIARARRKARRASARVSFHVADIQRLPYPGGMFDVVVATFVFCSVPDPILGLSEARRVLKPGGRLHLLEHVLSRRTLLRRAMRVLDPVPLHVWGAHIDRDTVTNVRRAGFADVADTNVLLDVVKRIEASAPVASSHE